MSDTRFITALRNVLREVALYEPSSSDAVLLERFRLRGDQAAFTQLVKRHGPLVLGVCRRLLRHEQDAEDVFRATFLVLARKADSIRKGDSVGSWLYGVAHRLSRKLRTAHARRQRHAAGTPAPPTNPIEDHSWRELHEVLDEEVARLPDVLRGPVLLCYFEGLTQDEAARRLGWKTRTLKARLGRARDRLRRRLTDRGLTLSAVLVASLIATRASHAVPAGLVARTTESAVHPARGVPSHVIALAEEGMRTMFLTKFHGIAAALIAAVLACGAGLLLTRPMPPQKADAPKPDAPRPAEKEPPRKDIHGDPLPPGALARLGTLRFRHGGWMVYGPAFLPDNKTLVTSCEETRAVTFWDVTTGKLLREASTGTLRVRDLCVSPDGSRFAVAGLLRSDRDASSTSVVRVHETSNGQEVRSFARESGEVDRCSLAFTPDGKFLASVGFDGTVRVEEIATGAVAFKARAPRKGGRGGLAVSPDGTRVAVKAAEQLGKVYVWQWRAEEPATELPARQWENADLAFSPDGKWFGTSPDGKSGPRLWDVVTGKLVRELDQASGNDQFTSGLAFAPDGKTLVASALDGGKSPRIDIWDVESGKPIRGWDAVAGRLAISPDSKLIAVVGEHHVRVWELATGKELTTGSNDAHRGAVCAVAAAPGIVATGSDDATGCVWDARTGRLLFRAAHDRWVRGVAVSPDGSRLASSGLDDTVRLWDIASKKEIHKLSGHGGAYGGTRALRFTPEGKRLLSWGDDWFLNTWDVAMGKSVGRVRLEPSGLELFKENAKPEELDRFTHLFFWALPAFSEDATTLVIGVDRRVWRFDAASGKEVGIIEVDLPRIYTLAASPDGRRVVLGGVGKQHEKRSPDGQLVGHTVENEHAVGVWDLATGKPTWTVNLTGGNSGALAFSPDGKTCAAACALPEPMVRLFDAATGKELPRITGFRGRVTRVTFTPDNNQLVGVLDDTTALVWDLPPRTDR